jgi:UV DNA damage endonuclease
VIRWGLCCLVVDTPIRFRSATHAYVSRLSELQRVAYINDIALHNANALVEVLNYCRDLDIRAFRVLSQLFPLATHPQSGYRLTSLPDSQEVHRRLDAARQFALHNGIRMSFHPDQFIVLNSARPDVVASAIGELEWQAEIAELIGADVICIHGGSTAGGIDESIARLICGIQALSPRARSRLALENDDRCFSLVDLLPAAVATDIPLILDSHHHRVLDGGLELHEATDWALATWGAREPYFHVSSPRDGWGSGDPRPHADFVNPEDVPSYWAALDIPLTVDVEAKAKERAVIALSRSFRSIAPRD